MRLLVLGLLFLGLSYAQSDQKQSDRDSKLFSLFNIVSFPNGQCTTVTDTTMYGTCYTASECSSKGGSADGNCAAGFGVCCMFTLSSCGSSVTQNCSYVTNPSYPTTFTTTGSCSVSVTPCNANICEMRLDFDNFDITETTAGVCTDSFAITGPSGRNPLDLCGTLTGNHIYFENARSVGASTLAFTIATGGTWKIKVSQIECDSTSRPYPDCDQYLTGVSGMTNSYNWPNVQLQGRDYTTCIRQEEGYCGIEYSQAVPFTSPDSFALDTTVNGVLALNGESEIVATAQGFITVPGVVGAAAIEVFSGQVLANTFPAAEANQHSTPGSLIVTGQHVYTIDHTTLNLVPQTGAVGFKLQWYQLPCSSAGAYYSTTGYIA